MPHWFANPLCYTVCPHRLYYCFNTVIPPSKNALARSCKKRFFFLVSLQDLARSCGILRDFAGILQEFCARFLQNPARYHKIPQDLARSCRDTRKKDLFLQDLARAFLLGCNEFYIGCI